MSVTLETMRKDYKTNEDIINELLKTPEAVVDFDRKWNGKYDFVRCGECNGPMLGHRAEKCRKNDGYEETIERKYETSIRSSVNKEIFQIPIWTQRGNKSWIKSRKER